MNMRLLSIHRNWKPSRARFCTTWGCRGRTQHPTGMESPGEFYQRHRLRDSLPKSRQYIDARNPTKTR